MRSRPFSEYARLFKAFRIAGDPIPVIDLVRIIAKALYPPNEYAQGWHSQRREMKKTWTTIIENALIEGDLPVFDPVTINRLHLKKDGDWVGRACITRDDFLKWLKARGSSADLIRRLIAINGHGPTHLNEPVLKPHARQRYQEEAILSTIVSLGEKPDALSKPDYGGGVKSKVCALLGSKHGWTEHVFRHAWKRLRRQKRICDAL